MSSSSLDWGSEPEDEVSDAAAPRRSPEPLDLEEEVFHIAVEPSLKEVRGGRSSVAPPASRGQCNRWSEFAPVQRLLCRRDPWRRHLLMHHGRLPTFR